MYSIYADGVCIYNDVFSLDDMKVVNPKLTLEDSTAGSLELTLPHTNKAYDTIIRMVTEISVKKHGEEIWSGRVLSESKDFWNNRVLFRNQRAVNIRNDHSYVHTSSSSTYRNSTSPSPPSRFTGATISAMSLSACTPFSIATGCPAALSMGRSLV